MPSIPQSLLWISLVVLWLFVLVPMLISKRDAVRRTSDVALATRVLNGGAGSRLLRRKVPPRDIAATPTGSREESDLDVTLTRTNTPKRKGTTPTTTRRPAHAPGRRWSSRCPSRPNPTIWTSMSSKIRGRCRREPAKRRPSRCPRPTRPNRAARAERPSTTTNTSTSRTRPAWSPTRTTTISTTGPRRRSRRPPHGGAGSTRRPPPRSAPANTRSASVC